MSEVHKDNDHNNAWLQPNTLQITTRAGKLTRGLCLVSLFHSNIFILFLFYETSWRFTDASVSDAVRQHS